MIENSTLSNHAGVMTLCVIIAIAVCFTPLLIAIYVSIKKHLVERSEKKK